MRRSLNILLGLSAFVLLLIGGAVFFTLPHWLIRLGYGEAKGPDEMVSDVSIYRSTSGDVLFLIPDGSSFDCYVFSLQTNKITIPSCGSQIHNFGVIALSNESPISGVLSSDRVKVESDMDIVISDDRIEFTTLSSRRVLAKRDSF